jgi:hypothetical protein
MYRTFAAGFLQRMETLPWLDCTPELSGGQTCPDPIRRLIHCRIFVFLGWVERHSLWID